jgi:hypothetical protein
VTVRGARRRRELRAAVYFLGGLNPMITMPPPGPPAASVNFDANFAAVPQALVFRVNSTSLGPLALISKQHASRIGQILLVAEHLDQFVGERSNLGLKVGCQFPVNFPPRVGSQFVAAA